MRLLRGIWLNLVDVRHFGPTVLARHLARFKRDRLAKVHVPRVGTVFIRAGESDFEAVRQIFVAKEYDLSESNPMGRRVQDKYKSIIAAGGKPIIVDAGANIGIAALAFATQFPDARIVAVEPDPQNVEMLRRNLGGRPNCIVVEAAIGAERGFVSLRNDEGYSWSVRTE